MTVAVTAAVMPVVAMAVAITAVAEASTSMPPPITVPGIVAMVGITKIPAMMAVGIMATGMAAANLVAGVRKRTIAVRSGGSPTAADPVFVIEPAHFPWGRLAC